MNLLKTFNSICTPAQVYMIMALISVFASLYDQDFFQQYTVFNLILIAGWTFLLHFICKAGYKNISWFLVLFPFIFILLVLLLILYK